MDNPSGMSSVSESAAKWDYQVIHDMLKACVDFKYTQSHIMSDEVLKCVIAELEYWHNLAERLGKVQSAIQKLKAAERLLKEEVNE